MTRVLIADDERLEIHQLRSESRHAGVFLVFSAARDRESFARMLRSLCPEVVLATASGLPGLPLHELSAMSRRAGAVVLLLGGDTPDEREMLGRGRALYDGACRLSAMTTLPLLIASAARECKLQREREQASEQLHQAAEQVRELQKMATIGQLTGSIAHEINNPLESITNLIYLMGTDVSLPEHMRPYLDLAQQELNRVAQIAKQTLSFYREAQTPVRVQLSSLLEEVLVLYSRRLNERRITVERRFEDEDAVTVLPGEIRQIFANLIANAIEATPAGGRVVVRLHKATLGERNSTSGMRVTVADSGHGIPADALRRLGQPFFTTKGQKGTGLGLWVSQSIVKRYGGTMRLRTCTVPGRQGTTFSLTLPTELRPRLVEMHGRRAASEDAEEAPERSEDSGLQLMVNGS